MPDDGSVFPQGGLDATQVPVQINDELLNRARIAVSIADPLVAAARLRLALVGTTYRLPTSTVLVDSDGNLVDIDNLSGAVTTLNRPHKAIHDGFNFETGFYDLAVVDDAFLDILIVTGATKELHLVHSVEATGDGIFNMYEGAIVSAAGDALPVYNSLRRGTPASTTATVTSGPTVTTTGGRIIPEHFIFGGTGPKSGGGDAEARAETVLKISTTHLIRFQNKANAEKAAQTRVAFYEVSPPA